MNAGWQSPLRCIGIKSGLVVFGCRLAKCPTPHPLFVNARLSFFLSTRQGTVGLELVQQVKEQTGGAGLDAVVVPVGGGGLITGVATAVKALCPGIRVIGAEPSKAADAFRSKQVRYLRTSACQSH